MLTFDDGVTIDTSGPLHCLTLEDGEYIVGEGVCIPVKEGEAGAVLHKMQKIFDGDRGRLNEVSAHPARKGCHVEGNSVQMILDTYMHYIRDDSIDSF